MVYFGETPMYRQMKWTQCIDSACPAVQANRQWTVEEILTGMHKDDGESQFQATQAAR